MPKWACHTHIYLSRTKKDVPRKLRHGIFHHSPVLRFDLDRIGQTIIHQLTATLVRPNDSVVNIYSHLSIRYIYIFFFWGGSSKCSEIQDCTWISPLKWSCMFFGCETLVTNNNSLTDLYIYFPWNLPWKIQCLILCRYVPGNKSPVIYIYIQLYI